MPSQKLRIILVSGCIRSGTTILDNILGQSKGFFSGGELIDFWQATETSDRLCACGSKIRECEIWSRVRGRLANAGGLQEERDRYQYLRLRHLWRLTTQRGREQFIRQASERAQEALELYRLISEASGAHTIIDSSKSVERAYLLTQVPELDVYVVHLVRDARAVAFSNRRRKPDPSLPDSYMQTSNGLNSAIKWILSQQVERLCNIPGRYLLVRYEDFMVAPDVELQRIFTMVGEPLERRPKITDHRVFLNCVHSINGNANRFRQGDVALKLDDEWQSKLRGFDRALVSAFAWPLLRHYGYTFSGRASLHGAAGTAN